MTRREEIILQLLERYTEFTHPSASGHGGDRLGYLAMPTTYTPSVRELERLLALMRDDRSRPLIVLRSGEKVSVRALWWHATERYIRCTASLKDVPVKRKAKGGKHVTKLERQVVYRCACGVDQAKADRAVTWLADNWAAPFEPMMPREVLIAA